MSITCAMTCAAVVYQLLVPLNRWQTRLAKVAMHVSQHCPPWQSFQVSLAEIMDFALSTRRAMASKNVAEILEELDSNGDGRLSLEEHLAPYKQPLAPDEDSRMLCRGAAT